MGQHESDVVQRDRFPLVQADEDVAALDAGLAGGAVGVDVDDGQAAVQMRVDAGHRRPRRPR